MRCVCVYLTVVIDWSSRHMWWWPMSHLNTDYFQFDAHYVRYEYRHSYSFFLIVVVLLLAKNPVVEKDKPMTEFHLLRQSRKCSLCKLEGLSSTPSPQRKLGFRHVFEGRQWQAEPWGLLTSQPYFSREHQSLNTRWTADKKQYSRLMSTWMCFHTHIHVH